MDDLVGVCFKPTGKVYYFSAVSLNLKPGDLVIAETTKGQELAEVVCQSPRTAKAASRGDLKPILRRATEEDIQQSRESTRRADEARRVCQRLVAQLEMAVKLVDVEYAFDGSRICFSFASEDRTDFRQLQRELGQIYECEIEIRRIGVRDQAKILGGVGPCGRQLCCASFLRSFEPVTIRMAKNQDLSLNPTKISGLCGRLMCCLRYEEESYREAQDRLPSVGTKVETGLGSGEVTAVDVLRERLTISGPTGTFQASVDDVTPLPQEETTFRKPEAAPKSETKQAGDGPRERESAKAPPTAPQAAEAAEKPPSDSQASAGRSKRKGRRRGRRSRRGRRRSKPSNNGGSPATK
jgi:cell fate regulator YaaT (PSP1 superfamily)